MDPEIPQNPIINPKERTNKVLHVIKSPKFTIVAILLLVAIVIIFSLKLISTKPTPRQTQQLQKIPATPSPIKSPNLLNQEINNKIESYNKKVDALNNSLKIPDPPQVQLDVTF